MEELVVKNNKYNFILIVISLLLALFLAEGILRICYPERHEVLAEDSLPSGVSIIY